MDDRPCASQAETREDTTPVDANWLVRVLLYGESATRRRAAERLLQPADPETWQLLVATVSSDERWLLRARALESLGLIAGAADQQTAEHVLRLLVDRLRDGIGAAPETQSAGSVRATRARKGR